MLLIRMSKEDVLRVREILENDIYNQVQVQFMERDGVKYASFNCFEYLTLVDTINFEVL